MDPEPTAETPRPEPPQVEGAWRRAEFAPPPKEAIATLAGTMFPGAPVLHPPAGGPQDPPAIALWEPAAAGSDEATAGSPDEAAGAHASGADSAEADLWAQIERAGTKAQLVDTPQAWHVLAMTAEVVSAFAQTMEIVAEAKVVLEQVESAADDARDALERAVMHAAESQRTATELKHTADEAERTAHSALAAAAQAEEQAEDAARVVPEARDAAEQAQEASARAKNRTSDLDAEIARAREVNTTEAWNRALAVARTTKSHFGRDNGGSPVPPAA